MSLQILLSVRKVLICSKSHNVFTHFLEDDSLNNLKHNDYVFVKITAKSTDPYTTTLVGEFKIIIGNEKYK